MNRAFRKYHKYLFIAVVVHLLACDEAPIENGNPITSVWSKLEIGSDNIDVRAVKIFDDKLYIAGGENTAALLQSIDGNSFQRINGLNLDGLSKITAFTTNNGNIYFTGYSMALYEYSDLKGLIKITNGNWGLLGEPSDINYFKNTVFISGVNSQYPLAIVKNDGAIMFLGDSMNPDCSKSNGIRQSSMIKLQSGIIDGQSILLGCTNSTNRYLYNIIDSSVNCFVRSNLSENDLYFGSHDFLFIGDSILSGGFAVVKTYSHGTWRTFGDSLPDTPQKFKPYVTALAVLNNRLFVGTNYLGVFEWIHGTGWKSVSEGLPKYQDGFYDSVNHLVVYKNMLFAGYGTGKPWASAAKGVYKISLQ